MQQAWTGKFVEMIQHLPAGFILFNDDQVILLANPTLLRLTAFQKEELERQKFDAILTPGGTVFYQTHFFPLLKVYGKVEEIYLTLRGKNGDAIPVLAYASRFNDGTEMLNECILVPIQQRGRYEEELLTAKKTAEAATRAKDEFLTVVSHELRTPLNAILGWIHFLRSGVLDEASATRAIEVIETSARSQAQLIEDILDFARIISGKMRLRPGRVNLTDLVEASVNVVRPAAATKQIRLEVCVPSSVPDIPGDADRLQQVFWNLLSNAIKFTPSDGVVKIRIESFGDSVRIVVEDSGQGIPASFLPYVFERYAQFGQMESQRSAGLGLGLSITRHLVELHGGTITAFSAGSGKGSTFTITLPAQTLA